MHRRDKFLLAATNPDFDAVKRQNEEQAFTPDNEVTHIVFVVHGIRDLENGRQRSITSYLHGSNPARRDNGARVAVASLRYGYFGMGPFLLYAGRGNT